MTVKYLVTFHRKEACRPVLDRKTLEMYASRLFDMPGIFTERHDLESQKTFKIWLPEAAATPKGL
jgi:hypothetical protein